MPHAGLARLLIASCCAISCALILGISLKNPMSCRLVDLAAEAWIGACYVFAIVRSYSADLVGSDIKCSAPPPYTFRAVIRR